MWNIIFFKDFQTLIVKKKRWKKEEKKGIKRKEPNLLLIIAFLLMSPTTQPAFYPCFWKRNYDMILIIRRNISSNGYNQYY